MAGPEERVARVVRGVVRQAMVDAGVGALELAGPPSTNSRLVERWCDLAFHAGAPALRVSAASKTELLLAGATAAADLYPLGDLYASELVPFGAGDLPPDLADLAVASGGIDRLDGALRRLLDERRPVHAAFAGLPHIRDAVMTRLQKTRFRRSHLGIIPKLGARTIGIDLHL
jgi:hypothetical protein